MANEAVLVIETELPTNFTSATAIEKGAILKMTSPRTASLADGDNDIVAGICQTEARSTDTSVSVYRGGTFRVLCHGTLADGDPVVTNASSGASNGVIKATTNQENILGIMMEDATEGQSKLMELRPTTMQLA